MEFNCTKKCSTLGFREQVMEWWSN